MITPADSPMDIPARWHTVNATSDLQFERPHIRGKFIFVGDKKLYVRGVTYGTFRPDRSGDEFRDPEAVARDFCQMALHGINALRTYTVPPLWFLDLAQSHGLRVMVGLPWEQHITFLDDRARVRSIEERVREGVRSCAGHPAVLCYAIGNEIPASIVRWHGARKIQQFIKQLNRIAKSEDPHGLFTYVNYPSTEYLDLSFLDFVCFNVYLEDRERLTAYLARLQNIANDRPLIMAEIGLDSRRNGEARQAETLDWQIRTTFAAGCAGAFVFSWTDEWFRGGFEIEDWDFGLTTRDRQPKAALAAVSKAYNEIPFPAGADWPRVSVVVCSYNGARTIRECFEGLKNLHYPNYEVIVVNDGSKDRTAAIANEFEFRLINTANCGLSSARNTGWQSATGEIVAYIDDDAYPDPQWLTYLAATFMNTTYAAVGGPNIPPPGGGDVAECVANAPGGPVHVLVSDQEAEHIPGCNMAFRKECLEAIGGFDPQYRAAGDDVDVCWRLQQRGWALGFSPSAVVWHHRRNSIRAYWKQQKGYGRAEALLERKWPEKYNAMGHLTWNGRIYGQGLTQALSLRRSRIYHGVWGSAPFQSIYQPADNSMWSMCLMPEWFLIIGILIVLTGFGALWKPLLLAGALLLLATAAVVGQAAKSAAQACFTDEEGFGLKRIRLRVVTALLHIIQPLARLRGRITFGLTPWRQRGAIRLSMPRRRRTNIWSESWRSGEEWLGQLEVSLRKNGAVASRGSDFDRWDIAVRGGILGGARVRMAVEEHGAGKQLLRYESWSHYSKLALFGLGVTASLSTASASAQAWSVSAIFGAITLLIAWRVAMDCAAATGALLHALIAATELIQVPGSVRQKPGALGIVELGEALVLTSDQFLKFAEDAGASTLQRKENQLAHPKSIAAAAAAGRSVSS
jgi:O-antigen biosynthesis protein